MTQDDANKVSSLTPEPPPIQAVMTATTRSRSLAFGSAQEDSSLDVFAEVDGSAGRMKLEFLSEAQAGFCEAAVYLRIGEGTPDVGKLR